MSSYVPRYPEDIKMSEKKQALRLLARRAKHLDKKWTVGLKKPDGFTVLSVVPVVGDIMSTSLATSYLSDIHKTFVLPEDVNRLLCENILANGALAAIPLLGWVLRRIFRVNRRNYRIVERYILSTKSKPEMSQKAEHKRSLFSVSKR
ncbi:hypothetical protein GQ54DRAFT_267017 [Martensiomyces pterosporus]|nr:hypothetical protein GQ54DRAFT_267017 [Martensiomyces pterosporus]